MSVLIGHASCSENGTAQGSKGDQTAKEVCTREWYNYSGGWDFIAIHPDADVREKHASAVEAACANDNVGYGQDDRNTLHTQAVKVDYQLSKITVLCNCDCSSLQHVGAIASGGMKESTYGSNAMTTSTMKSSLSSAGYVIITSSTYAQNSSYCVRGAIYVKAGHHTVTGLSNGSNYKKTLEKAGASTSSSTTSSTGSGTTSSTSGTVESAASYDASLAGTYKVNASGGLNVRYGAGTSKTIRTTLSNGTSVKNYGYYTSVSGTKWLLIEMTDGKTGFASSKYLTKSSSSSSSGSSSGGTTSSTSSSKLTVDGEIGSETVKRLQKFCSVTQDGFIDGQPSSGKKYWSSITSKACKWTGGKSDTVRAFQKYLVDKGYYTGTKAGFKDGKLGANTAKYAQKYLKDKGYYTGDIDSDFAEMSAKALQNWLNSY